MGLNSFWSRLHKKIQQQAMFLHFLPRELNIKRALWGGFNLDDGPTSIY